MGETTQSQQAGAHINLKSFIQSVVILLVLMLVAGTLTYIIPAGEYARVNVDGREVVDPATFRYIERPDYPLWRWATAPIEVLWGTEGITIIVIILFLLMVGAAFAVLDKSGILKYAVARIVQRFGEQKYRLLLIISFFFMVLGAFFGVFEEIVPMIPVMIALSYSLGWDSLVGLGMSVLATNMGFSAALTNPFSIGVAQELAGLPLFSGAGFRLIIFITMYALLAFYLTRYAKTVERDPRASPVFEEDRLKRLEYESFEVDVLATGKPHVNRALGWFLACLLLILLALIGGPFVPAISQFALPLAGLLFLTGGIGAGLLAGTAGSTVRQALKEGVTGIAPGIPLILMAASVKHIVAQGGIIDTLLYIASSTFSGITPFLAAVIIYGLALLIEFFISSASAKAFLLIPILLPLAELVGVTRQVTVLAYCFGDGFSNLAYPTSAVLLISLGLTVVSYPKWLKWTLKLWGWVILASLVFLGVAVAINFGPF
ncbi:MAG: YfcC family protein [Anaerolineae bacterium]|nr:YfcC family protein [Anaerolineae bacterium]